jgi:peptidoglycan/xylan/chitin deacetylase (PgdA/CDA1 family)
MTLMMLFSPIVSAFAQDSAVVLMYHRFGEDKFPSTSIRVEQFEAHLEHLDSANYEVVPLADVLAAVNEGARLPERAVAITIDDAYRSVYDVAYPLFKARGLPFTVFIASDPVDEGLAAYMTWDQMRSMAADGATFANHGAAHRSVIDRAGSDTDDAWLAIVQADVQKGARRLAEELEPLAGAFAYPYGEFDTATGDLLRELGYVSFGQHSGAVGPNGDLRSLPRYPMAESFGDIGQFRTKVASLPLPVLTTEPWDPLTRLTRPRIEVTLDETDARLGELACFVSGQGRVPVEWQEERVRFSVGPEKPFGRGRQRVNCTAPRNDGRYLWFSHPWIVKP